MVGPAGFEPVTPTMSTWYSNQLSYGPMYFHIIAFIICIFKKLFLGSTSISSIFIKSFIVSASKKCKTSLKYNSHKFVVHKRPYLVFCFGYATNILPK